MKKIIIICFYLFIGCQSIKNEDFLKAKELFENFDKIITPEEYAQTIYFFKDQDGLWRNKKDSLVTTYIPYKRNFFSFSNSFLNQNKQNNKGTLSRYISKYDMGIQTTGFYELENLTFKTMPYSKSIYIIFLNKERKVLKVELYSSKGDLIKESTQNFLQEIRRVRDQ